MKYPLKLIEWEDAFSGDNGWLDLASIKQPTALIVVSVGFEISREDGRVTLAQSRNNEDRGGNFITIPVAMIRREKTLRSRL